MTHRQPAWCCECSKWVNDMPTHKMRAHAGKFTPWIARGKYTTKMWNQASRELFWRERL